eukprot:2144154-Pyramimonas_sp.AAC.1
MAMKTMIVMEKMATLMTMTVTGSAQCHASPVRRAPFAAGFAAGDIMREQWRRRKCDANKWHE